MSDQTIAFHEGGSNDSVVDVVDLRKVYRRKHVFAEKPVPALNGVTLNAGTGQVFGLLGPNGAGKTTLVKTLIGVIRPTSGDATVFGLPAGTHAARGRLGYLPESLRVDGHHTARTALKYYGRLSGLDGKALAGRTEEVLEVVGLKERSRESIRRFSKGMNQRLGLAQALLHDPSLLILDEPTDGLDPLGRSEVRRVIENLRALGKTVFVNSHILQEVEVMCTHVAILHRGNLLHHGTLDDIRRHAGPGPTLLTVTGSEDPLRIEKLSNQLEAKPTMCAADPPEIQRIEFELEQSTDDGSKLEWLDHIVDSVRRQGWTILSLVQKRPSLEDQFMQMLREADQHRDEFAIDSSSSEDHSASNYKA
ncbi:MAG: ABC transporter ATP-binding protein [Planctomycetota bacterium]